VHIPLCGILNPEHVFHVFDKFFRRVSFFCTVKFIYSTANCSFQTEHYKLEHIMDFGKSYNLSLCESWQRIPPWWKWYYYLSPMAWTLYGLVASQLGDITTNISAPGFGQTTVQGYLHSYFNYKHSMVGVCAAVLIGFVCLFWLVFALTIRFLNFQKR